MGWPRAQPAAEVAGERGVARQYLSQVDDPPTVRLIGETYTSRAHQITAVGAALAAEAR